MNDAGARFCSSCGTALPDRGQEGLEVRKTVTILFCDVVGSTSLGEATDPETTRRVMSRYADAMAEVVRRHGGTVERFRGDEVMAVFGIPAVHEDDALRAVRAAAEMQQRLTELNAELLGAWGVELACRIGINTGEVIAGDPETGETFVTGDAVNLAKRLEQAADAGSILIGTATYPLVKDAVSVGPRERFTAKGKERAGHAASARGGRCDGCRVRSQARRSPGRSRRRAGARPGGDRTPLRGRDMRRRDPCRDGGNRQVPRGA